MKPVSHVSPKSYSIDRLRHTLNIRIIAYHVVHSLDPVCSQHNQFHEFNQFVRTQLFVPSYRINTPYSLWSGGFRSQYTVPLALPHPAYRIAIDTDLRQHSNDNPQKLHSVPAAQIDRAVVLAEAGWTLYNFRPPTLPTPVNSSLNSTAQFVPNEEIRSDLDLYNEANDHIFDYNDIIDHLTSRAPARYTSTKDTIHRPIRLVDQIPALSPTRQLSPERVRPARNYAHLGFFTGPDGEIPMEHSDSISLAQLCEALNPHIRRCKITDVKHGLSQETD